MKISKDKLTMLVAIIAVLTGVTAANARFQFTLTQVGQNVSLVGSGTINTSGLGNHLNATDSAFVQPQIGILTGGPITSVPEIYFPEGGLQGPASFGSGGPLSASSGSGDCVTIFGTQSLIYVPSNYVSNQFLSDSAVFANTSFSQMMINPGIYTYTWGSGTNADSLIVDVVPEPRTMYVGALCIVSMLLARRSQLVPFLGAAVAGKRIFLRGNRPFRTVGL